MAPIPQPFSKPLPKSMRMNMCVALLYELARGYKENPPLFDFVCDRALNEPFERLENWQTNPRQTDLERLIQNYRDRPRTWEVMRDRAQNDPDEQLRQWAQEQLDRHERA